MAGANTDELLVLEVVGELGEATARDAAWREHGVSRGWLYVVMRRMESKGWVEVRGGGQQAVRYALSREGREVLGAAGVAVASMGGSHV